MTRAVLAHDAVTATEPCLPKFVGALKDLDEGVAEHWRLSADHVAAGRLVAS